MGIAGSVYLIRLIMTFLGLRLKPLMCIDGNEPGPMIGCSWSGLKAVTWQDEPVMWLQNEAISRGIFLSTLTQESLAAAELVCVCVCAVCTLFPVCPGLPLK